MQLAKITPKATMSSREIAELAEASHDNVLKTIRALITEGSVFKTTPQERLYVHPQNKRTYSEFVLGYRDTMVVVSAYSAPTRARIIDRWQELEAKQMPALPETYIEALEQLLETKKSEKLALEVVEKQKIQLESQAYSVAYVDNFVKAEGLIGIREAGKVLGINQNALVNMLIGANVLFRENGHLQAYAQDIAAGRFVAKVELDANGKARPSTKFTSKGLRWVAGKLKLDQLFND